MASFFATSNWVIHSSNQEKNIWWTKKIGAKSVQKRLKLIPKLISRNFFKVIIRHPNPYKCIQKWILVFFLIENISFLGEFVIIWRRKTYRLKLNKLMPFILPWVWFLQCSLNILFLPDQTIIHSYFTPWCHIWWSTDSTLIELLKSIFSCWTFGTYTF